MSQEEIKNKVLKSYSFLQGMYSDSYFPEHLVDKIKEHFIELCILIETDKPSNLDELYLLVHSILVKIRDMEDEFSDYGSDLETAAKECITLDVKHIADQYGFKSDVHDLIAPILV